jgi:hypothetical protein
MCARKIVLAILLCLLTTGCDKINYEIDNSTIGKAITKAYWSVARMQLGARINMCKEKHDPIEYPKYLPSSDIFTDCMIAGGYAYNPAYYKASLEYSSVDARYTLEHWNTDALSESPNPKFGSYWIPKP